MSHILRMAVRVLVVLISSICLILVYLVYPARVSCARVKIRVASIAKMDIDHPKLES